MQFIKNHNLQSIKTKFQIIYSLTLINMMVSIISSNILITKGIYILSSNYIITNLIILLIEGIIPAIILYWENLRIKQANDTQLKYTNILLNITIFFFSIVDLSFLYNLANI